MVLIEFKFKSEEKKNVFPNFGIGNGRKEIK